MRDFIFHTFTIIDFISPTIKDHYMKCVYSKCFREDISWIYYQFAVRDYSEKLAARTAVNKYFDNEETHTNESARKELVHFKQRQRKKE